MQEKLESAKAYLQQRGIQQKVAIGRCYMRKPAPQVGPIFASKTGIGQLIERVVRSAR